MLFGSLACDGTPADCHIEIDRAVDSERYLALVDEALQSEFDVDVVGLRYVR